METCKCPRCKKVTCKHFINLKKRRKSSKDSTPGTPGRSPTATSTELLTSSEKRSSVQFKDPDQADGYEEVSIFDEVQKKYQPQLETTPEKTLKVEKTPKGDKTPEKGWSGFSLKCSGGYDMPPMVVMPSPPPKSGVAAAPSSKKKKTPSCPGSINVTPVDSQGNFGIKLPYDSDYDITVKVSLDENIMGCSEQCCEDVSKGSQPATKIKMKFETIKDSKNVQYTSDSSTKNTVNKKDSSYCCTKSISDHSSYYSANMSYHSVSVSCRSSVNPLESYPPPEIETQRTGGHLAAGCDFCKKEKPIKQLSKAADESSDVTSLYRCKCMSKSSEFTCVCAQDKTQKNPPSKSKIPIRKNEKCCSCTKSDFSKSTIEETSIDTTAVRTPAQSSAVSKEEEEPTIVKQVNIDLAEKIKEMEEGINDVEKKESDVKFEGSEDSASSDVFDTDKKIILPEVRVDVGPEKIKSIHIDVTPLKLDRSSSGIITIPVQLRFKRPPTPPPEAASDFSLKYDDKVIKAYFKTQKLLYENCTDCGENILETVEKPTNSDMDIILPTSCSKECQFIREVTVTPPVKKKRKLPKKVEVPWCHKSTYIEPYLKIDKCPTQETVEIQTDLSLGPKILSESLNSSCTIKCPYVKKSSKSCKKESRLKISWSNYTLPCPGDDMFRPVVPSGDRREIFPQPEELIVEAIPKKKCSIFPICGKPSPTTCVRPSPADQYKVLVRPQPVTFGTSGTSSTGSKPGTSGSEPKPGPSITTGDEIEPDLALGLKPTTPQLREKRLKEHPELRKIKSSKELEEEESYDSLLSPEPRARPYRPRRTFKKGVGGGPPVVNRRFSQNSSRTPSERSRFDADKPGVSERRPSNETKIPQLSRERRRSSDQSKTSVGRKLSQRMGSKQKVKSSDESTSSITRKKRKSKETVSQVSESSNQTPQESSKYISTVGQKKSSESCFSDSSSRYRKTPSFTGMREPWQYKSEPGNETRGESKKRPKSAENKSFFSKLKCCKRKPKSAPADICCPDRHVDFCMELPLKEPVPTIKKFVFLDKCPIHEPYLDKLHLENIIVPDGTMPWGKLLLPKNVKIRKISDIILEQVKPIKSHKILQINFNAPSRRASCPTPTCKSKTGNPLKECNSAPEWICKCDPKQTCSKPKSKADLSETSSCFASRDKSKNLKVDQSTKSIPCSSQASETVTYYMNKNMADTTESNKNLCVCGDVCPLCCQTKKPQNIPCSGYINRKSSAFVLKPDPVMEAFKQCEAELKPVREALAQVKTDLRSLNMPEIDSIFKNDDKEYDIPRCKCTKDTGTFKNVYKAKTEHFYANTTTCTATAIVEKRHKFWEYDDSSISQSTTSSEKYRVVPNKRNKGIQKTGSKHRKRRSKHRKKRLHSIPSFGSNSSLQNCTCCKCTNPKYSSADSSGRSTPRDYKICTTKNKKQQQIMPSNSDCPFLEAMRSVLLQNLAQDSVVTRTLKSKKIKKVKMHVKIKNKKH